MGTVGEPFDLSAFVKDAKSGAIYVKLADFTPEDGNGGFIWGPKEDADTGEMIRYFEFSSWEFAPETEAPAASQTADADLVIAAVIMAAASASVVIAKKR